MKKTSKHLNNRKHLYIHQLSNSQLKAASGGFNGNQDDEAITCGHPDDDCARLSVVVGYQYETHKVVLQSKS